MTKTDQASKLVVQAIAIIGLSVLIPLKVLAQQKILDPAGYLLKYDTEFNGVGPGVYVLPAPRTKEEDVRDGYSEINAFQDSISQALQYTRLLENWKTTSNEAVVLQLLTPRPKDNAAWTALINKYSGESPAVAAGLLNSYAQIRILQKETSPATSLLETALNEAAKQQNPLDIGAIQSNLSSLLIYNKEYLAAGLIEEAYYKQALGNKNIVDQAGSLLKIALIQAYDKDYNSAENTIIRKAIPLFNRAKDFEGKTRAWLILAEIYQMQNKHTEAQWFLIQARDLALGKNFTNDLAEIEYMLGSSKYSQKNLSVSMKELKQAFDLARKEENKYLELAIVEKMGRIYLYEGEIDAAEKQLQQYWHIRKSLF